MKGTQGPLALGALLVILAAFTSIAPASPSFDHPTGLSTGPLAAGAREDVVVAEDFPPHREPPPPRTHVVSDNSLHAGSRGPAVQAMEQRLSELHYMLGAVDGVFDSSTAHGVMAFQKAEGLRRTGRADPTTLQRLETASTPAARFTSPPQHIEVDVAHQVVLVVQNGQVAHVLPAVTGNGKRFWHPQRNRNVDAVTPNGTYRINRKVFELRVSPLGRMYWPSYFNGGIALHGSPNMVSYPGSHGCVRLPMQFAEWFYRNVALIGTTVYVYGGPAGENPQPYISDTPASAPSPSPSPSESSPPDPLGTVLEPSPSPSPSPTPSPSPSPTP